MDYWDMNHTNFKAFYTCQIRYFRILQIIICKLSVNKLLKYRDVHNGLNTPCL